MNDVLTLAVFAAKVLCLIVFVTILKPDGSIGAIRTSPKPVDCRKDRLAMPECGLLRKPAPNHASYVRVSLAAE
ncbi:hypothetical protein [Bradyrhizobium sp. URHC0002]